MHNMPFLSFLLLAFRQSFVLDVKKMNPDNPQLVEKYFELLCTQLQHVLSLLCRFLGQQNNIPSYPELEGNCELLYTN
jgi:hypothetical protein